MGGLGARKRVSEAKRQPTPKKRLTLSPPTPPTIGLTLRDLATLVPLIGAVVYLISPLQTRLGTVEGQLSEARERLARLEARVDFIDDSVRGSDNPGASGGFPSPAESVFRISLEANNSPFSAYLVREGIWDGVWTEVAKKWSIELGFADVQFMILPTAPVSHPVDQFGYLAVFLRIEDPTVEALRAQGWSQLPLDPYFEGADYGPFGYSIYVSPRVANEGSLSGFIAALNQVPLVSWAQWGKAIEEGLEP